MIVKSIDINSISSGIDEKMFMMKQKIKVEMKNATEKYLSIS